MNRYPATRERRDLLAVGTIVLLLNVFGWGVLLAVVAPQDLRLGDADVFGIGIGVTAFLLGARHAFDADHIAIIDNATRKLVGEGRPTTGTGLWFALGHSSVVFGLSFVLALGVRAVAGPVQDENSTLQHTLSVVGALTSGVFLLLLGLMNLTALVGIARTHQRVRAGTSDGDELDHHLQNRGFLARIFKRATQRVRKPWHLYPLGLLMGLGFDTATQVALLTLAGGTAAYALPWYAILVLPVLFTAGMTLFDTANGLFMAHAYTWAFLHPGRRIFYNFTVTLVSVLVAFTIGFIVLLQLVADELSVAAVDWVGALDLGYVGFTVVATFVVIWVSSVGALQWLERRRSVIGTESAPHGAGPGTNEPA